MNAASQPVLHAIVGPTASGKGTLARALAGAAGAEVLSVDSMKVYRRMDIGTAKPSLESRAGVPHHLFDLVEPHETFSVAQYLEAAQKAETEVRGRDRLPLHVGGTALYLKALRQGLFADPGRDEAYRLELEGLASREGGDALHRRLAEVDAEAAKRIHRNDHKRLIRALEVHRLTGAPISRLQTQFAAAGRRVCWIGLRWPREELHRRIDRRVDRMMDSGFLEEVRGLAADRAFGATSREAIGYRELLASLRGESTLEAAVEAIRLRTRQFARRQDTWFRSFPDIHWLAMDGSRPPEDLVETARGLLMRTA